MRRRAILFEQLETRTVMTALPFGAQPDDTGEYLLGDVRVTVVLLESDPTRSPNDNGTITYPNESPIQYTPENWTQAAIDAVKVNVESSLRWWEDTLDALPDVRDGLLNFTFDWTHADTPVRSGYEAIARKSNDFSLWMYDFLNVVGFNQTGNFSTDIRAFNNFQRQQSSADADWAFTIFVVNDANDPNKAFAQGGNFGQAFAFSGGRFMVVPASRPASTIAHEAGHLFWALDEYAGGASHTQHRGYYNTQNTNAEDNPAGGFVQQPSIMALDRPSNDPPTFARSTAFAAHTTSQSSAEMLGWKDSDDDGIFDVLDVPFTLDGTGRYDLASGSYLFSGNSAVRTFANQNPSGNQNDITINRIRQAEFAVDNGPWQIAQAYASRTYQTPVELNIPLSPGEHTIRIRTVDTRTGAMSPEFVGTTSVPAESTPTPGGIGGFVFYDANSDGGWSSGEVPLVDWGIDLVDQFGGPVTLQRKIEPNDYLNLTVLNGIHPQATLSAIGTDVASDEVLANSSSAVPTAQKVFYVNSFTDGLTDTWNSTGRRLRVDFASPVASVSIRALGAGGNSFGRFEAYDAAGNLLERDTTGNLLGGKQEVMRIARPTADIAYVVARAHMGTEVVLDTLIWGPGSSATTNILGAYSLGFLESGTYRLKVTPPGGHVVTLPVGGIYTVSYAAGQSFSGMNFGIRFEGSIWHNPVLPVNVNNDPAGIVNALDLLTIINYMVLHAGTPQLPVVGNPNAKGYVDVDNNGVCNALDLLTVINHMISNPPAASQPFGGSGEQPALFVAGGMEPPVAGEGEAFLLPPADAAQYYARGLLHLSLPGDEDSCEPHDHVDHEQADRELPAPARRATAELPALAQPEDESLVFDVRRDRLDEAIDALSLDVAQAAGHFSRIARRGVR
ncbi:MAG: dockerin type I domain-containing protein [Pirellulaceae bacterium]